MISGELRLFVEGHVRDKLEEIGQRWCDGARQQIVDMDAVDTGRLRDSVSYQVQDNRVFVGTDVSYGPAVHFGTFKMAGRPFLERSAVGLADSSQ